MSEFIFEPGIYDEIMNKGNTVLVYNNIEIPPKHKLVLYNNGTNSIEEITEWTIISQLTT